MKHRILKLMAVLCMAVMMALFTIGFVQAQAGINYSPFSAIRIWQALKVHGFADVDGATTLNSTLDVDGAATLNSTVDVDGAATLNSTVDVDGAATLNSDATVADDFIISAQAAISVTDSSTITPTGTYQPLESAGTVTATLATSGVTTGSLLTLVNTSNTTINIEDTGTAKLSAAGALGQYDSLILWFDGTNWIEVSRSDN